MNNQDTINKMLDGEIYSLAKIISKVERNSEDVGEIMQSIFPHCSGANVVGITGPPGAGKSSIIYHLAKTLKDRNKKVAVLAIDPNSHITGGALLGDRIRMDDLKDVYIRSIGNRCLAGGISSATYFITKVLEACNYEYIFIETVGAGQSEVKIKDLANFTMLVLAPGLGDDIQANKAGIMEIGDVLVVNKADKADAKRLEIQLKDMLNTSQRQEENTAIFATDSINGNGFDELVDYIQSQCGTINSKADETNRLKLQYIDLVEIKMKKLIEQKLNNDADFEKSMKKILQGELNIIELMENDIQDIITKK